MTHQGEFLAHAIAKHWARPSFGRGQVRCSNDVIRILVSFLGWLSSFPRLSSWRQRKVTIPGILSTVVRSQQKDRASFSMVGGCYRLNPHWLSWVLCSYLNQSFWPDSGKTCWLARLGHVPSQEARGWITSMQKRQRSSDGPKDKNHSTVRSVGQKVC